MDDDRQLLEQQQLDELIRLTNVRRMDWIVELANCQALLRLAPGSTTPFEKAGAVKNIFDDVLESAYTALSHSPASTEDKYALPESQVLAAGALLGLVTEWPREGRPTNAQDKHWTTARSGNKSVRQQIAASWIGRKSDKAMALDRHGTECLHAFHVRLFTYPKPDTEEPPPMPAAVSAGELQLLPDATHVAGPYIARPDLEASVLAKWQQGPLNLWGDAGTGKSTLARQLACAMAQPSDSVVVIDASNERTLMQVLALALDSCGVDTSAHDAVLRRRFRDLIESRARSVVVVIDNAQDPATLADLLPPEPKLPILVTSRRRLLDDEASVPVGNMTAEQAMAMVRSRLPTVSDDGAKRLIEVLDCRPLAIEHSCGFLRAESGYDVDRFCDAVKKQPAEALEAITAEEPGLTAIYRLTIGSLDPQGLRMLDVVAACPEGKAALSLVCDFWDGQSMLPRVSDPPADQRLDLVGHLALRSLARRGLIELEADHGELQAVLIHALTHRIIRSLRHSAVGELHKQLLAATVGSFAEWQTTAISDVVLTIHALGLSAILGQIAALSGEIEPYPDLAMLAAVVTHASTQAGWFRPGALSAVVAIYDGCANVLREQLARPTMPAEGITSRLENFHVLGRQLVHFYARFILADVSSEGQAMAARVRAMYPTEWLFASLACGNDWTDLPIADLATFTSKFEPARHSAEELHDDGRLSMLWIAHGVLAFRLSEYDFAQFCYTQAFRLLLPLAAHGQYKEELLRVGLRMAELALRQGRPELADDWVGGAFARQHGDGKSRTLEEMERDFGLETSWADFDTLMHAHLAMADSDRYRALLLPRDPDKSYVQSVHDSVEYRYAIQAYEAACKLAYGYPQTVHSPAATYGRICLLAVSDPHTAYEEMRELRQQLHDWGWQFAALRCELASLKLSLYLKDFRHDRCFTSQIWPRLWEIYLEFLNVHHSPFWAVDTLLTRYVICRRFFSRPEFEETLADWYKELKACLATLGRYDRLQIADKAGDSDFSALWLLAE